MIEEILLSDAEEKYAPAEKVLKVGVVGDIVFLTICKNAETYTDQLLTNMGEGGICVNYTDLQEAVDVLRASAYRSTQKPEVTATPSLWYSDS